MILPLVVVKLARGVLGGGTVILKLPELMIVKVTVVSPVKDSDVTLVIHEGGGVDIHYY
jgi:hypothetical protein